MTDLNSDVSDRVEVSVRLKMNQKISHKMRSDALQKCMHIVSGQIWQSLVHVLNEVRDDQQT